LQAGKLGAKAHRIKVVDSAGKEFVSLSDAALYHEVSVEAIRYRIKHMGYVIIK
jgi:hypothetical protein